MKTKILSILLTVAMLVAMVPMIAVSAEETGVKTVTVYSPEDIFEFLDSDDNVQGNIMELGADIHYENCSIKPEAVGEGYWSLGLNGTTTASTRLKASVDGNGHTVYIPGGTYQYGAILCYIGQASTYTFKNLKVVMASEDAVATGDQIISLFGDNTLKVASLTFENCYFDLNLKATSSSNNSGTSIILARQSKGGSTAMTVKNCYFEMDASVANGRHGALLGRRYGEKDTDVLTFDIQNSVFDVSYTRHMTEEDIKAAGAEYNIQCTTLVGDYRSNTKTTVKDTTKGNLYYNNTSLSNEGYQGFDNGFTNVKAGENPVTTVKGYQTTAKNAETNKFDLRLVGLVDVANVEDLANYSKVGFVVVANYANINTKWTSAASNKVYNSLSGAETDNTATGGTGIVSYEASDFGADYLYALAIKNIPANQGVVTLEVTPYYIKADGTTVVYGATENVEIDPAKLADNTLANG